MSDEFNQKALAIARQWLGTPYLHQASCKGAGTDCLGLVRGIFRELYGSEPESAPAYSADWAEASGRETLADAASRHLCPTALDQVHPGDVLLFRMTPQSPAKHAAILSSAETIIHAYSGRAVCETHLGRWWRTRMVSAWRWPSRRGGRR